VAKLISQLKLSNPISAASDVESPRSTLLKYLKEKATHLRSTLLDHMWKEDIVLLPMIVQSFSSEDVSQLVQNIMALRPTEMVQTIVQLMTKKKRKDVAALAAGPKIPPPMRAPQHPVHGGLQRLGSNDSMGSPSAEEHTRPEPRLRGCPFGTSFKRWGPEDDELLQTAFGRHNGTNWKKIAEGVPGRNGVQCYQRWQRLKPNIKGNFTQEEDRVLLTMAGGRTGGVEPTKNWREIANQLPGRSGKQCRDRWRNVLDPSLKRSKWTKEEDGVVLEAHQRLGNSWTAIQQMLPRRTQLQIRDRHRTLAGRSANPTSPAQHAPQHAQQQHAPQPHAQQHHAQHHAQQHAPQHAQHTPHVQHAPHAGGGGVVKDSFKVVGQVQHTTQHTVQHTTSRVRGTMSIGGSIRRMASGGRAASGGGMANGMGLPGMAAGMYGGDGAAANHSLIMSQLMPHLQQTTLPPNQQTTLAPNGTSNRNRGSHPVGVNHSGGASGANNNQPNGAISGAMGLADADLFAAQQANLFLQGQVLVKMADW
jgi:hypothetical protein